MSQPSFWRSALVLMVGTASAQLLIVLAAPVLARLYSPEAFGLFGAFTSILGVLAVFITLRYTQAIVLPEDDGDALHIGLLSLLIAIVMTLLVALLVVAVGTELLERANLSGLVSLRWLFPVSVLSVGAYNILYHLAIRSRDLGPVSRVKITQGVAVVVTQMSAFTLGPLGLVLGQLASSVLGTAALARTVAFGEARTLRLSLTRMLALARRYRRFPGFDTWGAALNTAGLQLPPLLFAALFGPAASGHYVLAHRVLSLPTALIGRALADAFLARAAEAHRRGDLAPRVTILHDTLSRLAMPVIVAIALFGPDVFGLLFGEDWRRAGHMASWMAPWIYFVFITSPLSTLTSVLERQGQAAAFQAGLLTLRIVALFLGSRLGGIELAVALFSLLSSVWLATYLSWILRASGVTGPRVLLAACSHLGLSFAVLSPLISARALGTGWGVLIGSAAATGVLLSLYYTHCVRRRRT